MTETRAKALIEICNAILDAIKAAGQQGVPVHPAMPLVGAKDAAGRNLVPGGQGFDPPHSNTPLEAAIVAKGYAYSHTTPIHMQDGSIQMHHTYAQGEHKVGVSGNKWETKVSSGSGHSTRGVGGDSLAKHLGSKAKRYC